jgi:N-acetylglucosamine kinase-like BadF-type ATPase
MSDYVIGVDGGNSKTDVVVASTSGRLLSQVRGLGVDSPLYDPGDWRKRLIDLVDEARRAAHISLSRKAATAAYFLANVDVIEETRAAQRELDDAGVAAVTVLGNDTMAVLRAGASRPWGVAVVAGSGINAVGVHPSGRTAGFLAFGDYCGDSGGGRDIGVRALGAGVRAQDGRGPGTVLSKAVPALYGLRTPQKVAVAIRKGLIEYDDLLVLAPLVFAAAAAGDAVASRIMADFADEVVSMATALINRLRLTRTDVEVVLGGGTLQAGDPTLFARIGAGVSAVAPAARLTVLDVAPVFGAVVEALRRAGADEAAVRRAKKEFLAMRPAPGSAQ